MSDDTRPIAEILGDIGAIDLADVPAEIREALIHLILTQAHYRVVHTTLCCGRAMFVAIPRRVPKGTDVRELQEDIADRLEELADGVLETPPEVFANGYTGKGGEA